jgi:hypothetical protein
MRHALIVLLMASCAMAQKLPVNYDEAKVGNHPLPDPLIKLDGSRVADPAGWPARRAEILALFEREVYGRTPASRPAAMRFQITDQDKSALGGKATRKQIAIHLSDKPGGPVIHVLIYLPNDRRGPAPTFLGLNFNGNHTTTSDPAVPVSAAWMRDNKDYGVVQNRASEAGRGKQAARWSFEQVIARGYASATAYYGDIDPDFDDGFQNGVHPLFYAPGQTKPAADEWGSIGAWAWGLARIMDYLQTDPEVDSRRVIVHGHSRLGKTSLWAGAQDPRFAAVVSNCSGAGGAALARRDFGETVAIINKSFPHWFCDNYTKYDHKEADLPVDQHQLIALIAPRPVLVNSAQEDKWADPRGEFLSVYHAGPVFRLLGKSAPSSDQMPALNQAIKATAGYHIRPGKHDVLPEDWQTYIDWFESVAK